MTEILETVLLIVVFYELIIDDTRIWFFVKSG